MRSELGSSPSIIRYNHLKKQGSNFKSLAALTFHAEYVLCYYLIFHVPNFWSHLSAIHNCERKVVAL